MTIELDNVQKKQIEATLVQNPLWPDDRTIPRRDLLAEASVKVWTIREGRGARKGYLNSATVFLLGIVLNPRGDAA